MILLLTEGQVSDYRGAATVLPALPDAEVLIADKGYNSNWFRDALSKLDIEPCIPGRSNCRAPIPCDADRCAHTFMSAICIAATVIFWL